MLAEKLGTPVQYNLLAGDVTPSAQFQSAFTTVANLTTFNVNVKIAAQADLVAMFNYSRGAHSLDVGYNFWGRSCEKICKRCASPLDSGNTWALKGDAFVYGYASVADAVAPTLYTISASCAFSHRK